MLNPASIYFAPSFSFHCFVDTMCFTLDMDKERSRALASVSLTHAHFNQLHVAPYCRGVREESGGDVTTALESV